MKLVILGATGKTGKLAVEQALAAGHTVTALVRRADAFAPTANLVAKVGDARNASDLTAALAGQEAVISTLGSNKLGDDLMLRATNALIQAAHASGVKRVVMMSSFLVAPGHQRGGLLKLAGKLAGGLTRDKAVAEDLLKASDLDWTIVYATALDAAPAGRALRVVGAGETVGVSAGIARADAAKFLLECVANPASVHTSPIITTK